MARAQSAAAALVAQLREAGWTPMHEASSGLISGLTWTALSAPVGKLIVHVEQLRRFSTLTLEVRPQAPWATGGDFYPAWHAAAPLLPLETLGTVADAVLEAAGRREIAAAPDELVALLAGAGWTHREERSHDQSIRESLTSPDSSRTVAWGDFEYDEDWRIERLRDGGEITALYGIPVTVLRALAEAD